MRKRVRHFDAIAHHAEAASVENTAGAALSNGRGVASDKYLGEGFVESVTSGSIETAKGEVADLELSIEAARAAGRTKTYGPDGLVITLRKESKMSFLLRWSKNGKVRWKKLGEFPRLSVQEAIDLAKSHKAKREDTSGNIRRNFLSEPRQVLRPRMERQAQGNRIRRIGKLPFRSINAIARFLYRVDAAIIPQDIRVAIYVMIFAPMAAEEVIFGTVTDIQSNGTFAFIDVKSKPGRNKTGRVIQVYLPQALVYRLRSVPRGESDRLFQQLAAMEREDAISAISAEIELCNKGVGIPLAGFLESFRTLAKRRSFLSASAINSLCDTDADCRFYQPSFLLERIGVMEWWVMEILNAYEEVKWNFDSVRNNTGLSP